VRRCAELRFHRFVDMWGHEKRQHDPTWTEALSVRALEASEWFATFISTIPAGYVLDANGSYIELALSGEPKGVLGFHVYVAALRAEDPSETAP
jgi:hypothetical protein